MATVVPRGRWPRDERGFHSVPPVDFFNHLNLGCPFYLASPVCVDLVSVSILVVARHCWLCVHLLSLTTNSS